MAEQIEIHENRGRAESFGSIAQNYDRYRPGYPPVLIDTLMQLQPQRVLDIGCGTGKAAIEFVQRGVDVLGVEIDARMAEVARAHGIEVEVDAFETWQDLGRTFDLIISGQAWHWVEPVSGAAKAGRLLEGGGTLALFWNTDVIREPLRGRIDAIYRDQVPELMATLDAIKERYRERPYVEPLEASGMFTTVATMTFESERHETTAQWIGKVGTHSDHVTLEPERRERLLADAARAIDECGGIVRNDVSTYLVMAHRED